MDINRNGVDMLIDKKRLNIYFAFVIISVIAVDLFTVNCYIHLLIITHFKVFYCAFCIFYF
jgi:hypothetical protein